MKRDEVAEKVVDTVLTFAFKKYMPAWPAIPISQNIGVFWDAQIPKTADPQVLKVPAIIVGDLGDELYLSRISLPGKEIARRFRRRVDPASSLIRVQWYELLDAEAPLLGDIVLGVRRGTWSPVGSVQERISYKNDGRFIRSGGKCTNEMHFMAMLAPGVRTVLEASWVARIRFEQGGPSVEFPTDPEGVYALFKDRRCEGGKKKRLLHWVKGHCRVTKKKSTEVIEHLRGAYLFVWQDCEVRITPPADSLERTAMEKKVAPSITRAVDRYREMVKEYEDGQSKRSNRAVQDGQRDISPARD